VIAPVREWNLSREQEINYALSSGIPVTPKKSKYSIDQNLWGRSIECGELEDPNAEPDETAFEWTTPPEKAPDRPEYVMLEFKGGVPTSLNGECKDLRYIIQELNGIAGRNGVGRIDHIEDRVVGIKSREVYECPAASVIIEAHKDLEKMTLTKHQVAFKSIVDEKWAELLYTGLWVDPLREDLERFIVSTQRHVNGSVRLKLYKGGMRVVGRSSPNSLYDMGLATYEERSTFDQRLSSAFIELWGLQSVTANKAHGHSEG
jgi:argininosuccinate synthase